MIMLTVEKLSLFIERELKSRNWSQAELSRRSGIDTGWISNLLSGNRKLGLTSLLGFVKAFGIPADKILREAGLLPPVPERTEAHEQVLHLWDQLSEADKTTILRMMAVMIEG